MDITDLLAIYAEVGSDEVYITVEEYRKIVDWVDFNPFFFMDEKSMEDGLYGMALGMKIFNISKRRKLEKTYDRRLKKS